MITQTKRNETGQRVHARIRANISGTDRRAAQCIPLLNHIYAQLIDDQKGITIVAASSIKLKTGGNVAAAKEDWQESGRAGH